MVANWVQSQHTAFIRWCNIFLLDSPLSDLSKDFSTGVKLCRLTEQVTGEEIGKYHKSPKYLESYENVQLALDLLKHKGVNTDLVGAPDIVDGNLKMILGLVWQLILKFTVDDINQDGQSAKDGLLLWCKRKAGFCDIDVSDFSKSWQSGLAMCAIIDNYRPDLLEFDDLPRDDPLKCIQLALDAAEKAGLPMLLEASDIANGADEKSLITTMAYWYHSFSALDRLDDASRRIQKFCDVWAIAVRMKREYESRMKSLLDQIATQQTSWSKCSYDSFEAISIEFASVKEYKSVVKRKWSKEKSELLQLYGNIRIKLGTYGFKQYIPPDELSPGHLNTQWLALLEAENLHAKALAKELHIVKDKLRHEFANKANTLASQLYSVTVQVSGLGGDLDSQLVEIVSQSETLVPLKDELNRLKELDGNCRALGIEDNDYTVYTFDELAYELKLAERAVANKFTFIENQIVAQQSSITPELLDEFETIFRHCDQTHRNKLDKQEFKAALASLGTSEDASAQVFEGVKDESGHVSFHSFIMYMKTISKDEMSIEQVCESFREISNGKEIVTRQDFENALLSDETINTLIELLPTKEKGYDFQAYLSSIET